MKIGIIFATVGGATRECAELLQRELNHHEVELFDIADGLPDLRALDVAVIGFPIRMGKPIKSMRKYLKNNAVELKKIKTAYYICCGFVDCFEDYAEKCIPVDLSACAIDVACLGGSLDPARVKGFDRIVVKAVRNEILGGGDNADQRKDMVLPTVMPENISQLADKIRGVRK